MGNSALSSERWLDRGIKLLKYGLIIVVAVFGGYYAYNRYSQSKETPVYKVSRQIEEAVRKNPRNLAARIALGTAYLDLGRYDDAITQFKEAQKLDKENQEVFVYLGRAYVAKGWDSKALQQFDKEIDLYGKAGYARENRLLEEAYFQGGVIYWKKKKYDKAAEYVRGALEIGTTDADNHFFMGRIYLAKDVYDSAIIKFEEALRFDPKHPDAHYGLGLALEKKKELGRAVGEFKKAYDLALSLKDAKKRYERLLSELEEAVEKKPKDAEAHRQLGIAYRDSGSDPKATAEFNEALKLKPEYALIHVDMAIMYENKEQTDKAMEEYKKALAISPNLIEAKQGLQKLELEH
jgi:tetratricopeptide (TPR) repeat protein